MSKSIFDFIFSLIGLIVLSPILFLFILLIWLQDRHSPFYIAPRVGKNGKIFKIIKLRTMIIDADKYGVDSTSSDDTRITKVGHIIRKYKLDEFSQLWNVFIGQMSLVGPRPQVKRDVDNYTVSEKDLLNVFPGITDFSSIVFADEGEILSNSQDPDLDYNQLIRPWKSRLALFYIKNQSMLLDVKLILLTIISIISRQKALNGIHKILVKLSAEEKLIEISKRKNQLTSYPPPGSDSIVTSRE
ncbi:MAG: sugar transferase [Bacteroidetes bacterium]|nr:sugar transferase [Bacteroidota bacterium]